MTHRMIRFHLCFEVSFLNAFQIKFFSQQPNSMSLFDNSNKQPLVVEEEPNLLANNKQSPPPTFLPIPDAVSKMSLAPFVPFRE